MWLEWVAPFLRRKVVMKQEDDEAIASNCHKKMMKLSASNCDASGEMI